MTDKPQINMRVQADRSILFDASDGVTVRVAFDSATQVRVEMWRDSDSALVPPDVGNIGTKSFRERLATSARGVFDGAGEGDKKKSTVPNLDTDLGQIAILLGIPEVSEMMQPEASRNVVDQLVELVEESGTLFTTPSGRPHVAVEVDGHTECYALDDGPFEDWLRGHFYKTEKARLEAAAEAAYENLVNAMNGAQPGAGMVLVKRPPIVKALAVTDAINQLRSIALVGKKVEEVFLRVGGDSETFYLDLGNEEWEAVEVDARGWRIVQNPPVKCVRAKGMLPLPKPERGGSLLDLRDLLNVGEDEDSEQNWALLLAWLVQTLRPVPQHPILGLRGGEGTAKSFTAFLLRSIADPHDSPDDYQPPDLRTLCLWADHEWVISLDNLSSMPEWLSNALCKLCTGMGFKVRTLYSNRGLEIFKARRPVTLNGIADIGTNKDLMSRTLLVNLPVISKYMLESEVMEKFEAKRPGILGALLDAASAGIRSLPELRVEGRGSRMPDFDLWGRACEEALGLKRGAFLKARGQAEREATQNALEADPMAVTIQRFAAQYSEQHPFKGSAEDLLGRINEFETDDAKKRHKGWADTPGSLGKKLSKLSSSLRVEGVFVDKLRREGKGRGWLLYAFTPAGDTSEDEDSGSVTGSVTDENPAGMGNASDDDTCDTYDSKNSPEVEEEEGEV